ncbi:GvpL/GvpF family gas vesicle protein [Streptomyces sp. NPDC090127]|uniref:GvpL/GvpF family gas vesicle protein n=1 Tax=Streptomyces sp. NPDC090127 TaxID=3365953 RepID=UPI0037FF08F9
MSTPEMAHGAPGAPGREPDARPGPRSAEPFAAPSVVYVYGIGRDDEGARRLVRRVRGVDGHAVELVAAGGLVALVSVVPGEVFDEAALRRQLEDLTRLEEIARSHHAVVDAAFAESVVLPLRLATVYLDEGRVADMLAGHLAHFTELLAWLDGHVELGVKVHADPEAMTAAGGPTEEATAPAPATSPGRAYLQQRRQHRRSTEELYRSAGVVAAEVTKVAQERARATVAHRPQQGELSGRRGVNISNHAYLVPMGTEERFREDVEAVARAVPGVRVEVTGPWAPYSFATPSMADGESVADGGVSR